MPEDASEVIRTLRTWGLRTDAYLWSVIKGVAQGDKKAPPDPPQSGPQRLVPPNERTRLDLLNEIRDKQELPFQQAAEIASGMGLRSWPDAVRSHEFLDAVTRKLRPTTPTHTLGTAKPIAPAAADALVALAYEILNLRVKLLQVYETLSGRNPYFEPTISHLGTVRAREHRRVDEAKRELREAIGRQLDDDAAESKEGD
jgi:hypothetical protein